MEIGDLIQKLAAIREKFVSLVNEINTVTAGKPFYARITLENNWHLTGLISNLRVNEYKFVFNFTEEKLVDGKPVQKTSKKEIKFEKFRGINLFQMAETHKPIFLGKNREEGKK
ncbi:MAG: hypothetical protein NT078_02220 [Candidatus Azambacteria bacterium]|nr:hypothetical protein [Candidatus Azambacteria bacterium]